MQLNGRNFLIGVILLAVLLRFVAVLALRDVGEGPLRRLGADGVEYSVLATSIANGDGYCYTVGHPTSFRAPGFPLFLAVLYGVFGVNYWVAYASFCLLGALACAFAYGIGREVASEQSARWAALLAVIYVPHVYFATCFDSENLFAMCLGAGTWFFLRYLKNSSAKDLAAAGLSLGWGALTRPFALLLLPLFAGILVVHSVRLRKVALIPFVVFAVPFLAIVLAWTARNYLVFHQFVLVATNGGSTFYGGNNDLVLNETKLWGGWISTNHLPGRDLIEAMPDEVSHDKMEWKLGVQWLQEHVAAIPRLEVFKLVRLWLPDIDSGNKKYVRMQIVGYVPFLVLFAAGWIRCLRDRSYRTLQWVLLHGTILATVATALIFWGAPRFRDANAPVLVIYAAVGLEQIRKKGAMLFSRQGGQETSKKESGFKEPVS